MSLQPPWPALVATARGALWLSADGEIERIAASAVASRAAGTFPLDVTTEYFRVINEVASGNLQPADASAALQKFIAARA